MLLTLIPIGLLILSLIGIWLVDHTRAFDRGAIDAIAIIMLIIGISWTFVSTVAITITHTRVLLKQAELDMEYETLLNEVAYIKDLQNEPVSDLTRFEYATVAEHVLDWNKRALEAQTLGNSPWTNWFYNDAERSMKLIEFK